MSDNSVPTEVITAFQEAVHRTKRDKLGVIGTLADLTDTLNTISRLSRNRELIKLRLVLGDYRAMFDQSLEKALTENFRDKVRSPIPVPNPADPEKTVRLDMSAELRWIAYRYQNLRDLFGDISEDFYYKEAEKQLVPDYVDEALLPIVANVLIECFQDAIGNLRKLALDMLQAVALNLENDQLVEANDELWEHIFIILKEAVDWPSP